MTDPKRQDIKDRVAASEARNEARDQTLPERVGESAVETKDGITGFVKRHPLATIAGGIAIGVLVAGLFPSTRRAARQGGTRAAALGAAGAETVVAALGRAMDAASHAGRVGAYRLEDLGDTLGDSAREARREALYHA